MPATPWAILAYFVGIAVVVIILGFAAVVVWRLISRPSALDGLIAEPLGAETVKTLAAAIATAPNAPTGPALTAAVEAAARGVPSKASLSRFQFLLFTFVVAGLFLLLSIEAGGFVEVPPTVLGLIGISGGSFVISKGISNSNK